MNANPMSIRQLGFFIRIAKIAVTQLEVLLDSCRQQILKTIEYDDACSIPPQIPQFAVPNETKAVTKSPAIAEREAQSLMDFLEQKAISKPVFVTV